MKTIPVDYNAMTPSGSLRLDFDDTKEALIAIKAQPGDYIWTSDGEVLLGARLETMEEYGLVASPRWQTLVRLDDYMLDDRFRDDFPKVLEHAAQNIEETGRAFQMLATLDQLASADQRQAIIPVYLTAGIATSLYNLEEFGLALSTLRHSDHGLNHDSLVFIYLDVLWEVDPIQAGVEAYQLAEAKDVSALVLAACIDIGQRATNHMADRDFEMASVSILKWIRKFERAPRRDQIRAAILAHVYFNLGIIMLRLGQSTNAMNAFDLAHKIDPEDQTIAEARTLGSFNETARQITAKRRRIPVASVA